MAYKNYVFSFIYLTVLLYCAIRIRCLSVRPLENLSTPTGN